jgi:hypothetical protein
MSMPQEKTNHSRNKSVRDKWEYRLIFLASYPIFLGFEILDRCLHLGRDPSPGKQRRSVFAAAREAADTSLPYAFLG